MGAIQGEVPSGADATRYKSPLLQEKVVVRGIVHELLAWKSFYGDVRYGMLIQDAPEWADKNPNTSDGLMVYLGAALKLEAGAEDYVPRVGDDLVLQGVVEEYHGQTQLGNTTLVKRMRSGLDVDKVLDVVELDPPQKRAESDAYWEKIECMRAVVTCGLSLVSHRAHNSRNDDGEAFAIRSDHPVALRKNPLERRVYRDPHPLDDLPNERFDNGNGYLISLSSQGLKAASPDAHIPPFHTYNTLAGPVRGGVIYSFSNYMLALDHVTTVAEGANPVNLSSWTPTASTDEISLATFNVENLYDFRNDPFDDCDFRGDAGCKGVNGGMDYVPVSEAAYRQHLRDLAGQIVHHLHSPDLVMLQELEDQDICTVAGGQVVVGKVNNADGELDVLQDLMLEIASQGGGAYRSLVDRHGTDERGIIVGMLYNPERIRPAKDDECFPLFTSQPGFTAGEGLIAPATEARNVKSLNAAYVPVDDGDSGPAKVFTRAPLAVQFKIFGKKVDDGEALDLVVMNNHFSSRPDARTTRRTAQAALNAHAAASVLQSHPEALVIVGGDLNVYPHQDDPLPEQISNQLKPLYESGLVSIYDRLLEKNPAAAYSYVYQGQTQTLDHLFLSPRAQARVTDAAFLHLNSDWPDGEPGDSPMGGSDHDPLVIRLRIR